MGKKNSKFSKQNSSAVISPIAIDGETKNELTSFSNNEDVYTIQDSAQKKLTKENISSRRRIVENFTITWLDSNSSEFTENYEDSIIQLRRMVNSIETFNDPDDCIKFIKEIENEKVFLIVSSTFYKQIVSFIQEIRQIESIYVLSDDKSQHEKWSNGFRKVKGEFNKVESICEMLGQDIRQTDKNLTPISILTPSSPTGLNELNQSFMYSPLLKETLLEIKYDDKAKKEFVEFCRVLYSSNDFALSVIDEFERDYDLHAPIWWYTRESFIYSMLNRALRTQEVGTIIKIGFFIRDLHRQIEELQSKSNKHSSITVYRGQGIVNVEFEKIVKSKGGLLSFNSFLSTSTDRKVSLNFARQARNNSDHIGILFQMEIDSSILSSPFASLENTSYFANAEKEILFSMHTVFRIGEIKQIENCLWQVNLISTSDKDEQLEHLTQYMREEIQGQTGFHQLAYLMGKIGEFDKAEECYKILLQMTSNDDTEELAFLQHQLGCINKYKGDFLSALSYYESALEILQKSLPPNHPDLATTTINIGEIHRLMKNHVIALSYFEKSLELLQKSLPSDHPSLATIYSNIGLVHDSMGNFSTALSYFQVTLQMRQKSVPTNHPSLAITYNNIGGVYRSIGDYSTAISYYGKALEIQQKSLPVNHPNLGTTYNKIGMVYQSMEDYSTAISYYERAIEIGQHSLNHPFLQTFRENLEEVRKILDDHFDCNKI